MDHWNITQCVLYFDAWMTGSFYKKHSYKKNEPQKPKNLKKMLKKSPASDAWAAIFENAGFS